MAESLKEKLIDTDDITDIKEDGKKPEEKHTLLVFSLFYKKNSFLTVFLKKGRRL